MFADLLDFRLFITNHLLFTLGCYSLVSYYCRSSSDHLKIINIENIVRVRIKESRT